MKSIKALFSLKGKNALVIGGAGYLGTEISKTLAEQGANVFIASRDIEKCTQIATSLKSLGVASEAIRLDLADRASIRDCFKKMSALGLDILVNNAGAGKKNSLETIGDDDWDYDLEMNLNAVFRCVKAALPALKKSKGVILNVSSMYGYLAPDYHIYEGNSFTNPPSYGAAKAGVIQFTKYLAAFLSKDGIRVNCVSPGAFPHAETQKHTDFMKNLSAKNPMSRIGYAEDIKGAVALLCSDASSYMTGQNLRLDGGWGVW